MRFVQINDKLIINLAQIQYVLKSPSGEAVVQMFGERRILSPDELAHLKAEMAKADPPDPRPVDMNNVGDVASWPYEVWEGGKRVD